MINLDRQIEKLGQVHRHIIQWNSFKKFYPTDPGVMEKWLRKDGRTDGRTCKRRGYCIRMLVFRGA